MKYSILAKKVALLTANIARLCKYWIVTLFFEETANFQQIVQKTDHNIDPRLSSGVFRRA
jgi:hypothetical protein